MSTPSAPVELTLLRSPDDYAAYQKQVSGEVMHRSRSYRVIYWGSAVIAGLLALAVVFFATGGVGHSLDAWQFMALVLAFFGAWSLMNYVITPLLKVRAYPRLDLFCSPVRLTMTDTALQMSGRGFNNAFDWTVITDVVETPQHVFVRVDGISSIVVPRRDFSDAAQLVAFVQSLRAHIAAARPA